MRAIPKQTMKNTNIQKVSLLSRRQFEKFTSSGSCCRFLICILQVLCSYIHVYMIRNRRRWAFWIRLRKCFTCGSRRVTFKITTFFRRVKIGTSTLIVIGRNNRCFQTGRGIKLSCEITQNVLLVWLPMLAPVGNFGCGAMRG